MRSTFAPKRVLRGRQVFGEECKHHHCNASVTGGQRMSLRAVGQASRLSIIMTGNPAFCAGRSHWQSPVIPVETGIQRAHRHAPLSPGLPRPGVLAMTNPDSASLIPLLVQRSNMPLVGAHLRVRPGNGRHPGLPLQTLVSYN